MSSPGISLSFSGASKYLLSPFSWYAHYVLRLRNEKLSSSLIFGSALDVGFNTLLNAIKKGHIPDLDEANYAFVLAFQFVEDNGIKLDLSQDLTTVKYSKADLDETLLTEYDRNSGLNQSWLSLRNKGMLMIEEYAEQVLPQIQEVLAVQLEINLPNEQGDVLTGIVDFIAKINGKVYLCDNKSTSVSYKADSADNSEQLATYFHALEEEYKLEGVMFVTVSKKVRKRKLPRIEIELIPGQISEDVLSTTFDKYEYVLQGIKNKEFDCSGMCLKQPWSCTYKNYCRSGGEDLSGLVVHEKRNKA